MTATCSAQEIQWWSDKCGDCGHILAAHRDGTDTDNETVTLGDCTFCEVRNELQASIEAQNTALREYAGELNQQAKDFAEDLQTKAKAYIDAENERFQGLAQRYVDGQATTLNAKIDGNQTAAKAYVDQQDKSYQNLAKGYVDQQIPLVIAAKVQASALK